MVIVIPEGGGMAVGSPHGESDNVNDVVFASPEPEPVVLGLLKARLASWRMA